MAGKWRGKGVLSLWLWAVEPQQIVVIFTTNSTVLTFSAYHLYASQSVVIAILFSAASISFAPYDVTLPRP